MKLNFTAATLLAMSLALAMNVHAEETVSDVTSGVVEERPYVLPNVQFAVSEEGKVQINMFGFRMQDVSGFYYNGYDITKEIASGIDDGSISGVHFLVDRFMNTENREVSIDPSNAFTITLMGEIEPFELEGNTFSLTLVNGLEIRRVISFEESKFFNFKGAFDGALAGCSAGTSLGGVIGGVLAGATAGVSAILLPVAGCITWGLGGGLIGGLLPKTE